MAAAGCLLALALAALLQLRLQAPPPALGLTAPAREFSAARAFAMLASWDQAPHPLGTPAHDAVRNAILAQLRSLGLQGTVEAGSSYLPLRGPTFAAGYVQNITAVLPGAEPHSQAVLLVAHYDSVPHGLGAGDDGANAAALIETLRALRAGPPLRHDVIALFSDGEEAGMLGAARFVKSNPLRLRVGVVVNFEGRGNAGPSQMFETSAGNGGLIHELAAAHAGALADSLMYAIYRRLPNDTDLSVFKHAGIAGLNFAYSRGFDYYHSPLDSPHNLSRRTLQNQGAAMLAAAQTFGNADLQQARQRDVVYLNPVGHALVVYPMAWVRPVAIVPIVLFLIACVLGLHRRRVSPGDLVAGALLSLAIVLASAFTAPAVWRAMQWTHSGWRWIPQGQPYRPDLLALALIAWMVLLAAVFYMAFGRSVAAAALGLGALLWWLLGGVALAFRMPAAAHTVLWPLVALLIAWIVIFTGKPGVKRVVWRSHAGSRASQSEHHAEFRQMGVLWLGALGTALLMVTAGWKFLMLLPWTEAAAASVVFALALTALAPYLVRLGWKLPITALILCIGCSVAGMVRNRFTPQRAQPDSIAYYEHWKGLQATAKWVSSDPAPDAFTAQFLGAHPAPTSAGLAAPAPVLHLLPPMVRMVSDTTNGGLRTLWLHLASQRGAEDLTLKLPPGVVPLSAVLNGEPVRLAPPSAHYPADGNTWGFRFSGLSAAGVDLVLTLHAGQQLLIHVADTKFGLPAVPGIDPKPRAAGQTGVSYIGFLTDASVVSAQYRF